MSNLSDEWLDRIAAMSPEAASLATGAAYYEQGELVHPSSVTMFPKPGDPGYSPFMDHLFNPKPSDGEPVIFGMKVVVDPDVKPGVIEIRNDDGTIAGRIEI